MKLKENAVYLDEQNTIVITEIGSRNPPRALRLEEEEGYRVSGLDQCEIRGDDVSFVVRFARVGKVTLRVVPIYPVRGAGSPQFLDIQVRPPFCNPSRESQFLSDIVKRLDQALSDKDKRHQVVWVWGLPSVGKTAVVRRWCGGKCDASLYKYIDLADYASTTTTGTQGNVYPWLARQIDESCRNPSHLDRLWDAIEAWIKASKDLPPTLVLDHFDQVCDRELLLQLLRSVGDSGFKLVVVDVLPFSARAQDLDQRANERTDSGWKFHESHRVPLDLLKIEPFRDEQELLEFILEPRLPSGFVISELSEALKEGYGRIIISELYKMTGGHPALVNDYLCNSEVLYEPSGGRESDLRRIQPAQEMRQSSKFQEAQRIWSCLKGVLTEDDIQWLQTQFGLCDCSDNAGNCLHKRRWEFLKAEPIAQQLIQKGVLEYERGCILLGKRVREVATQHSVTQR